MRIQYLHLYTTRLQAQHNFYRQTLDLPTSPIQNGSFYTTIGHSQLHFQEQPSATPYHFAFNIPANKIQEALTWVQQRVTVQPYQAQTIVNFEAWNAQALYFYDADQNIVELIARKNTQPQEVAPFSSGQLLGISEIGAPTSNVSQLCQWLLREGGIPRYSGDLKKFAAIGDEEGLFIIINTEQQKWMPNSDPAPASPFELKAQQGQQTIAWRFENGQFIPQAG
jgi:hypothetical protein